MRLLKWLEGWYKSQCNGDWEHMSGIKIYTLDNPGWRITIDLADTELENKKYNLYQVINDDESDWIFCRVKDGCFEGAGDPSKLEVIIQRFKEWVEE
jgi:hypothetical protein